MTGTRRIHSLQLDRSAHHVSLKYSSESNVHVVTQLLAQPRLPVPPKRSGVLGAVTHVGYALDQALGGAPMLLVSVNSVQRISGYHDPRDARDAVLGALQSFSGLNGPDLTRRRVTVGVTVIRSVTSEAPRGWELIKRRHSGDGDLIAEGYHYPGGLPLPWIWSLHDLVHTQAPINTRSARHDDLLSDALSSAAALWNTRPPPDLR